MDTILQSVRFLDPADEKTVRTVDKLKVDLVRKCANIDIGRKALVATKKLGKFNISSNARHDIANQTVDFLKKRVAEEYESQNEVKLAGSFIWLILNGELWIRAPGEYQNSGYEQL